MFSIIISASVIHSTHGEDMIKKEASQFKDIYGKGGGKTAGTCTQLKLIFATPVKSKPPSKLVSAPSSEFLHGFTDTLPATLKLSDSFKPCASRESAF